MRLFSCIIYENIYADNEEMISATCSDSIYGVFADWTYMFRKFSKYTFDTINNKKVIHN